MATVRIAAAATSSAPVVTIVNQFVPGIPVWHYTSFAPGWLNDQVATVAWEGAAGPAADAEIARRRSRAL